jgi:hypothetical protein
LVLLGIQQIFQDISSLMLVGVIQPLYRKNILFRNVLIWLQNENGYEFNQDQYAIIIFLQKFYHQNNQEYSFYLPKLRNHELHKHMKR